MVKLCPIASTNPPHPMMSVRLSTFCNGKLFFNKFLAYIWTSVQFFNCTHIHIFKYFIQIKKILIGFGKLREKERGIRGTNCVYAYYGLIFNVFLITI